MAEGFGYYHAKIIFSRIDNGGHIFLHLLIQAFGE